MKRLEINNFRCFRNLTVDFAPGINLFVGDNASGKTSLLLACKYAINSFFSGFSTEYTIWRTPGIEDFRKIFSGEKKYNDDPIKLTFTLSSDNIQTDLTESGELQPQSLIKNNKKNSKPLLSFLSDYKRYGVRLCSSYLRIHDDDRLEQIYPLPLIASYSTQDIHTSQKLEPKLFVEYNQSPTFGYYHCSSTDGLLKQWVRRLLALKEADKNPTELNIVLGALQKMFGNEGCGVISSYDVRVNLKDIVCIFTDGRETPVSVLSDGYRRLFSIVVDIAFRCALLNSLIYGEAAAERTTGTVIIDEIDLHLHPSLQASVLKALHNTFPGIQFIVTTHAPMVMAGVETDETNKVHYIKYNDDTKSYSTSPIETYGMDISTLSEVILKVPSRVSSVEEKLNHLSALIDNESYDEAKQLLCELKSNYGDRIPELSMMETEILVGEELR